MPDLPPCNLIAPIGALSATTWATVEYLAPLEPGAAPASLLVLACRLVHAYDPSIALRNSAWAALRPRLSDDAPLWIKVHAIGTSTEMHNHAAKLMATSRPICNQRGVDVRHRRQAIACSNGATYRTQVEAAEALGVSQGHISQALRGIVRTVRGERVWYVVG